MALLSCTSVLLSKVPCYAKSANLKVAIRTLMSKQLVYAQFGDPLHVVKYRECAVPKLRSEDVLVRMLAAPVNPADINTIQGVAVNRPDLPSVPGDEGVGDVVEIGDLVSTVKVGDRVIIKSRLLGTWRYYGIYNQRQIRIVSAKLPLAEASMIAVSPCMAYRMIKDFYPIIHGQTVIQNAANSPCGQCVIQLCRAWGINTFNIVASHCGFEAVRENLLSIGATCVFTLEEAEQQRSFITSLSQPVLALNCLGGRYEDVLLRLLAPKGAIVYYGCAYDLPLAKEFERPDVQFHKFHLNKWDEVGSCIQKEKMLSDITQLMVIGKFRAPKYEPVEIKNFVHALRNTCSCEAFSTTNYVFDFTLP